MASAKVPEVVVTFARGGWSWITTASRLSLLNHATVVSGAPAKTEVA